MKSKAQLIQLADQRKRTEKVTWAIYRLDEKKAKKKYWKVGMNSNNSKIPQIYTLLQFLSMPGKNCGIFWLDLYNLLTSKNGSKSSKQLKIIFSFMSVLNTLQYKECLCILTLPKCKTYFTDKIFKTYRPEKSLRQYKQ